MRPAPGPRLTWSGWFLGCVLLGWSAPALAVKTDVLIMRNGDRITGEIKGLSYGKLDYSTDDAGRLSIEWEKVARLTSPHQFQFETVTGARYLGRLGASNRDGSLAVFGAGADTLAIASVVVISPINAGLLQRVTSYLDVGFTLAKANQATTFSTSGAANYQGETFGSQFKFDSYAQGQESTPTTTRNSARQSLTWYLQKRWSAVALAQVEQNEELALDHRFTGGGGLQRSLAHTNRMELAAALGAVATQEKFSSELGTVSSTNLEGLAVINWSAFRFDSPKLDFNFSSALFPSFSDWGRVRGQTDLRIKYELFKDFNVGMLLTDTFDSRPPDPSVSENDYVTTLTIGWSYRR
jgi:hypothetical protein